MSHRVNGSLPSAIGRDDAPVGRGYGRGSSGLVLPMGDIDIRFEEVAENHDSRMAMSMDSSEVMKVVAEALASFIPRIVSNTLKSSGYNMVLARRSNPNFDARAQVPSGDHNGFSGGDREPKVVARVPIRITDESDLSRDHLCVALIGFRGDVRVSRNASLDTAAGKGVYGGVSGGDRVSGAVVSSGVSGAALSGIAVLGAKVSGVAVSGGVSGVANSGDVVMVLGCLLMEKKELNALNTDITFISQIGMGLASPSRRVLWSEIADKEDEHNDVSSEVDESDHSQNEDAHNKGDVDPNVTSTINGSGSD
ncbi:hypothetical protein NE237_020461 [Protea cynaroides]|uniref:Uncharacterized protein n=1 Tax=Protea cynaroides TaxID=273540 RepID=A0A9Q0H8G3_9MAGN|nr:hypothetical protein NE237_020461 [Protea cynaroides]